MKYVGRMLIVGAQNAGCLEALIQAEQTSSRVLKLLEGAEWQVVAKALGQLVHSESTLKSNAFMYVLPCVQSPDEAV